MQGHLRRCRSALRAHVRPSTLRAQGSPSALHLAFPEQLQIVLLGQGSR
jgi:hypothetical protein